MAHFKRAPGVKACVVAGVGHAFCLDINVLLEGTPPQGAPVAVGGQVGGTRMLCVAQENNIKHNRLCTFLEKKVIHHTQYVVETKIIAKVSNIFGAEMKYITLTL